MKIRFETTAEFEVRFWVTEKEAHALYAISVFGAKDFWTHFQKMSGYVMQENDVKVEDLENLFQRLRSMQEQFKVINEARKTLTKNI